MTREQLTTLFNHFSDNPPNVEQLDPRYRVATHGDLCAFMLLEKLLPNGSVAHWPGHMHDIVECAEHDKIWLRPGLEALAAVASEEDVRALAQLGVHVDAETESLAMCR